MDFDVVLLDLGGVLIDIDYSKTSVAFEKLGMTDFKNAYSQAEQVTLFDDFETGRISPQRFINELLPFVTPGTSPNSVVHAWNAMILSVPAEKITLLETLKKRYPLYLLSNTNALHVPIVRKEWAKVTTKPLEAFFDKIYLSHEIHLRKPFPETFHFVCNDISVNPSRVLFIDDSIQHVLGAREAGLQAIHLQDTSALHQLFS